MKSIVEKVKKLILEHRQDVFLIFAVILISLLSFAGGYIICSLQQKEPLIIEEIEQ